VGARSELVQSMYDAFGRGDIPTILGALDDGVVWTAPDVLPQGGTFKGPDEVGRFFAGVADAWEDIDVQPEALGDIGEDLVVVVASIGGKRRGGGPAGWGAVHVWEVRDGKVTRFRELTDLGAPID
jgi:ketosteroid isomerase-like protein